jgi:hypothetical protein
VHDQFGHQRLGFRRGHADAETASLSRGVSSEHDAAAPVAADHDKRRLNRRRGAAHPSAQPVGRPGRQEY